MNAASSDAGPVTVMVSRKVRRGHEAEYEAWLKGINSAASAFPGFLGVNVIRPGGKAEPDYVSIFRFDSYTHLKAWQDSDQRREWLAKIKDDMIEGEARTQEMTGFEFWFTPPDGCPSTQPPRHKMVIVLVIVIFCMLNALAPIFSTLSSLHPLLRSFIVITTQVILMTYVIMPLLMRVLSRWLFAETIHVHK